LISKDTTEEMFFAAINAQKQKKVDEFMLSYQNNQPNTQNSEETSDDNDSDDNA